MENNDCNRTDGRDDSGVVPARPALAVVAAVALFLLATPATVCATTATGDTTATTATTNNSTASVVVENQTHAGRAVIVSDVTLPEGGYLVVHGSRYVFDRVPDPLASSAYLSPGTHERVAVALPEQPGTNTYGWVAVVALRAGPNETVAGLTNEYPVYRVDGQPVSDNAHLRAPDEPAAQPTDEAPTTTDDSDEGGGDDSLHGIDPLMVALISVGGLLLGALLGALAGRDS